MLLHTYASFRCLCHILCSGFGVKYALKRRLCYCCTAVWSFPAYLLWFLVVTSYFSFIQLLRNQCCVVKHIHACMMHAKYTSSVRMLLYTEKCFETTWCVCVSSHSFWTSSSLDVPAGVTQEEGHTGFLIHLLSAVRALIFLARRIQPFLSLVDREVEFCVLTI